MVCDNCSHCCQNNVCASFYACNTALVYCLSIGIPVLVITLILLILCAIFKKKKKTKEESKESDPEAADRKNVYELKDTKPTKGNRDESFSQGSKLNQSRYSRHTGDTSSSLVTYDEFKKGLTHDK